MMKDQFFFYFQFVSDHFLGGKTIIKMFQINKIKKAHKKTLNFFYQQTLNYSLKFLKVF